ncbi:MAG: T9SS type A sorting domain-containing protein, partial [Flavobacterium sp.]
PMPATPSISASGATTFCEGGSVTLTSSSATGNSWSNGATTQSITVSASGNYSVLVNNGTCASASSAAATVTVNQLPATPTISASGATTFCEGGSVTLSSSSATGNIWSNGATTQSITVSASGNYSVLVNNGTCASALSAATSVVVNALPDAGVTQSGGVVTATQPGASYQWFTCSNIAIPGETGQTFIPTEVGDYLVVVSNGDCSATSACISVTQLGTANFTHDYFRIYPNPVNDVLNIEYTGVLTKVELFNIAGQKLYSASANAGATQIDMSSLPAGIYLVKAASDNLSQTFKVVRK